MPVLYMDGPGPGIAPWTGMLEHLHRHHGKRGGELVLGQQDLYEQLLCTAVGCEGRVALEQ